MKTSTTDKIEGNAKNISGKVKEAAGRVTGNDQLRADGKTEQLQGQIQKKIGEIKKALET